MLAARFARIREAGNPVRYAMDPAHARAIRNYLAIASRAEGLPGSYRGASHVLDPIHQYTTNELGLRTDAGEPLMPHLFHEGLGGDHGALAAYFDLLHEHASRAYGDHPITSTNALLELVNRWSELHHNIAGHGDHQAGAHPAVLRGYGEEYGEGIHHARVSGLMRALMTEPTTHDTTPLDSRLSRLLGELSAVGHPLRASGAAYLHNLRQGSRPADLIGVHDVASQVRHEPGAIGATANQALGGIHRLLQSLHPTLWHYGETGQLP